MEILIRLLICSLASSAIFVQKQNRIYYSPDRALSAIVIPVGKKGFEEQESRIEIRDGAKTLLRWRSFASSDGEHGRGVYHAQWTADGQFFVFNAPSSGGHQPWNLATYFYSRKRNRFYSLDDFIGPATSDFTLQGRNSLKITRMNFERKLQKETVRVRLENVEGAAQRGSTSKTKRLSIGNSHLHLVRDLGQWTIFSPLQPRASHAGLGDYRVDGRRR